MDYTLTKKEVERILNKSGKTISRYIKQGKLNPVKTKRKGYDIYLFSSEEVTKFKPGDTPRGQGTNQGTFRTEEGVENKEGVKNLHGETGGTNQETKEGKKDTPGDTEDRTQGTPELEILRETLGMLKQTLENQSKQIDNQSKQIENLTNTQNFLINENSGFRKMLGLGTTQEDIMNNAQDGVVVDTGDKVKKNQGTKKKRTPKKKTVKKRKTTKGQGGQNQGTTPVKKKKDPTPKKEAKKKFNFIKWLVGN